MKVHVALATLLLSLSCSHFVDAAGAAAGGGEGCVKRDRDGDELAAGRRIRARTGGGSSGSANVVKLLNKRTCGNNPQHTIKTIAEKLQTSRLHRYVAALSAANEIENPVARSAAINELQEKPAHDIASQEVMRNAIRAFPMLPDGTIISQSAAQRNAIRTLLHICPTISQYVQKFMANRDGLDIFLPECTWDALEVADVFAGHTSHDQIAHILTSCSNLKTLHIGLCAGAQRALVNLAPGRKLALESLNLNGTDTTAEELLAIISHIPHIRDINLTNCAGAAAAFSRAPTGTLTQLESIDLSDTNATAEDVRALLIRCPKLKTLSWTHDDIADAAHVLEVAMEGLPKESIGALKKLHLTGLTPITPRRMHTILQHTKLNTLRIAHYPGAIDSLSTLPIEILRELEYSELRFIPDNALNFSQTIRALPRLKTLQMSGCPGATNVLATLPAGTLRELEFLNLGLTYTSSDQLLRIILACPRLTTLTAFNCPDAHIAIEALPKGTLRKFKGLFAFHCPNIAAALANQLDGIQSDLEYLSLSQAHPTQEQFLKIIAACRNLKHLDLSSCVLPAGSLAIISTAIATLSGLKELDLAGLEISAPMLQRILRGCPKLSTLNIAGCQPGAAAALIDLPAGMGYELSTITLNNDISDEQISMIQARFPGCTITNLDSDYDSDDDFSIIFEDDSSDDDDNSDDDVIVE